MAHFYSRTTQPHGAAAATCGDGGDPTRSEMNDVDGSYSLYFLQLNAKGVPVGPVMDWREIENDPDLNNDGTIVEIDQGDARGKFKTIGVPCTFSNYTPEYKPAPKLGENNVEILTGLGFSEEQIKGLMEKGVIGSNDGVKADLVKPGK